MIYLNHAATSYPKPIEVINAVSVSLGSIPREGRRSTVEGADELEGCRRNLARLIGASEYERIFFTSGATESFNLILRGLPLEERRVLVTSTEHNALLRPLYALLKPENIDVVRSDRDGFISPGDIEKALTPETACVFVSHCSNVTGAVQDIEGIGQLAHSHGALLCVDAAQSVGALPIDVGKMGVDILVFTGHKALCGPEGTGGFYAGKNLPLLPAKFGGTGSEGDKVMPNEPGLFEVGTQNISGIAGLRAGAALALDRDLRLSAMDVERKMVRLRKALEANPNLHVYGGKPPCAGALAFNIEGLSPADVGYALYHAYGIVVRAGYHCAPLIGEDIKATKGSVRVSISHQTTDKELEEFAKAAGDIARGALEGKV